MGGNATGFDDGWVLLHPKVFGMYTHDQLDQAGQSQEKKYGGKCHMVRKVDSLTLISFELNKTITGAIHALTMARTVGMTRVNDVIHFDDH